MSSSVARDIDLALLGVLPLGHLLGGVVEPTPRTDPAVGSGRSPSTSTVVALGLSWDEAESIEAAGGVVLRDDEMTPLARFEPQPAAEPDGDARSGRVLTGLLTRMRERESGVGRRLSVDSSMLGDGRARAVVVFRRPPTEHDTAALPFLEPNPGPKADSAPSVLAIVSDDPDAHVPPAVMLDLVRLWFGEVAVEVEVRTAPLAWRDTESNAELVRRLGLALGGEPTIFIDSDDGSTAARAWAAASAALDAGTTNAALDALSPKVAQRLRRWRPLRSQRGLVLMFSGLSGSGKSTLARDVSEWITQHSERQVSLLDGDVVRTMLSAGLGFSRADRELNIQRIGFVAAEVARHGGIAICAPIAPYASTRAAVRDMALAVGDFVLVHVSTPLAACEARDLKGLYAKARAGLIPEFTGISDVYEEPIDADLSVDTSILSRGESLDSVVEFLRGGGWLDNPMNRSTTGVNR